MKDLILRLLPDPEKREILKELVETDTQLSPDQKATILTLLQGENTASVIEEINRLGNFD